MQNPSRAVDDRLAISGDRRNGINRLILDGELDASSVLFLEAELNAVAQPAGALILDLRGLTTIDGWGLRALERATRRADRSGSRLIVVGQGLVLDALQASCIDHLLSGSDLSDLLGSDDATRAAILLPPLPGQRTGSPSRVMGEAS